jgi:hypothetical protein
MGTMFGSQMSAILDAYGRPLEKNPKIVQRKAVKFHPAQSSVFRDLMVDGTIRNAVVVASRGFGKTYLAAGCASTAVDELLRLPKDIPNKNVYVIAPTYDQVTDIYFPLLNNIFGLGKRAIKKSRADGIFEFANETVCKLVSYESVERLRGTGCYFAVNDEVCSWVKGAGHKGAWEDVIEPCISSRWSPKMASVYGTRPGRSLTISTPKGYNYFYDMYTMSSKDADFKGYHFDYRYSPYLDPNEIRKIKERIDPLAFAREYLARFQDSGANLFYCFDRNSHVSADVEDLGYNEDVHFAIDFNVGIQATSVWTIRGGQPQCIAELKGHPDTEQLAKVIKAKYDNKARRLYAYPDPSGKSRKTSAPVGQTDFSILRQAGIQVLAHSSAPSIADSTQCVNRMLLTASGAVNMYIHPRCTGVIESLEKTVWAENNPDLAVIDKKAGVEHFSDGVRYFIEYNWPIKSGSLVVAKGGGQSW